MDLQENIERIKEVMGLITEQLKVLDTVVGPVGKQPISNPDLDSVHGILGSKRIQDDFSERVTQSLKDWNGKGYKTDVSNIQIKTYVQGNQIITESSCNIVESTDGNSYNEFTTRGSIGDNYNARHDEQVSGLIDRLKQYYGGNAKQVGKTFIINFKLNGNDVFYKQSFFVANNTKSNEQSPQSKTITIKGNDFNDLRNKLKENTQNISIDPNSIKVDINNYSISYLLGSTKIQVISLIFDDKGQLDNRLVSIKSQNPTLKEIQRGKNGNVEWIVAIIYMLNNTNSINEEYTTWVKRRMDMVRDAEREASSYMVNRFKQAPKQYTKSKFTHAFFSVMMDELHGDLSNWGTQDFDYSKVHQELRDSFNVYVEELWNHLNN